MCVIRRMEQRDLDQVAALENRLFSPPWSEKNFRESLKNQNTLFLVAEIGTIITGYCGIYFLTDEGEITNVAVASDYQRKGIAKKMLSKAMEMASACGVKNLYLEVRRSNTPAVCLYEQQGFVQTGVRKNYYTEPTEDALILWWHLP